MVHKLALSVVAQMMVAAVAMAATGPNNTAMQAGLGKELAKFKNVAVTVDDGVVELNGEVDRFNDRARIEKEARRYEGITRVIDRLTVSGPMIDNLRLAKTLRRTLSMDDETQGNPISVSNGTVTVIGVVRDDMERDAVLWAIGDTRGVKGIIDHLQVNTLRNLDGIVDMDASPTRADAGNYVGPSIPWTAPWRQR